MSGHNPTERALFTDLTEKNRVAREFRRLSADVRRWRERGAAASGKRWRKQYAGAVERGQARLVELRAELLARAEDLKARIAEEQKISDSEIQKYEKQYKKELLELKAAQDALAEARKAVEQAKGAAGSADDSEEAQAGSLLCSKAKSMPRPLTKVRVVAVPKSIAKSLENSP